MTDVRCRWLLVAALGSAAAVASQGPTSFSPAERQAFELKGRGRYAAARDRFVELCRREDGDARVAALVEFHAVLAHLLGVRIGDRSLRGELIGLAEGRLARAHPTLRDRLLHLALDLDLSAGDHAGAMQRTRELGYIDRYWILGPFDNERGGGFARPFGPERGFDPTATYDGKKRPIQWRPLPVPDPPGGFVDLDALVRPDDQVLCYAAVALIAERAQELALHLGSDESFRVFLNGVEVGARDVRRAFAPDQDAYRLPLRAGANLLLLKVCDQEGAFAFAARLRAADGRPVAGVVVSDAAEQLLAASRALAEGEPRPTPDAEPPFRGALTVFQSRATSAAGGGDPHDAFRLGLLLGLTHPDDPGERRDHDLARLAVAGLDDFPAARYLLAFTRTSGGRAEERDDNARRLDYEAILAAAPEHAESLRSLAELELDGTGIATTAERRLRRALEIEPDFAAARVLLARALRALDLDELAEIEIERAARLDAAGRRSPVAARALFRQRIELNRHDDAHELVPGLLATTYDATLVEEIARARLRRGADAIELLEGVKRVRPFARGPRRRLARLFEARGELERASAELRAWLEICPEDDEVLVDTARISGLLGHGDRQRELLRTALDLNPNRKTERRYLEFLEVAEKPFYDDFVIDPDDVIAADPGPPDDATDAHDPYHHLLRQTVVRAYRNGTTSQYRHEVLRVLTEDGARRLSDYVVPHFWGEQRARLLEVRVHREGGEVARPRLRGSYVKLPSLRTGDRVSIRSRVDDIAPSFFGDYFGLVHRFASPDGSPVAQSELVLALDPGRSYRFQSCNGAPEPEVSRTADGVEVRRYAVHGVARRVTEERRPSWHETEPLVRVTTYADWDQFAGWWWNLIRKQSEVSPAMRDKVRELTQGATDERQKIEAIYRFVTTDIRYKAWEFGVHGYRPYRTSVIFDRRHGDCKDKSLLLNAMLAEVGIQAYPVLIWADSPRSNADLSLPMVEHFNHCISYLPPSGDRPEMWLDGTATYHPVDTLPDMDNGATVLVVSEGRGAIRECGWVDAAANVDARVHEIELAPSGDATISMRLRPLRNQAVWVRERFGNEPAKRRENLERMLGAKFGNVRVLDFQFSELLDLDRPVAVDVRFTVSGFVPVQDGGLALGADLDDEPLQRWTSALRRQLPLLLPLPHTEQHTIRYRLPQGYEPSALPPPVDIDAPFGSYRLRWTRDGARDLVVERERSIGATRIQPQEYAQFREFAIRADEADRQTVVVREKQQ